MTTVRFLAGERFSSDLDEALMSGTSIGGARPQALLQETGDGSQLIAKLSTLTDPYPVVRAAAVAMNLAARVGLNVARTTLTEALGRDVLLVEVRSHCGSPGAGRGAGSSCPGSRCSSSTRWGAARPPAPTLPT